MDFSSQDKQKFIDIIKERIPELQCPICHKKSFTLTDGYVSLHIQKRLDGVYLGGPMIPSVGLICNNCGYVSLHAIGALGLMPEESTSKNKE